MKCQVCGKLLLYAQRPVGMRNLFNDEHIHCGMEEIRKACVDTWKKDSQTIRNQTTAQHDTNFTKTHDLHVKSTAQK